MKSRWFYYVVRPSGRDLLFLAPGGRWVGRPAPMCFPADMTRYYHDDDGPQAAWDAACEDGQEATAGEFVVATSYGPPRGG